MPDFSKGVIYKITTPNGLYIGSSCDFKRREDNHRINIHNKNSVTYNFKLYRTIRENNEVWKMEKIKDFPCENYSELRKEETKVMLELNANLNEKRAYTSVEERKEQKKEYGKAYSQAHKEQKKEQDKQRYEANKEKIKEQSKKYCQAHKEQNREKVECECGCKIGKGNLAQHRKSKKHLNLLSNKE